jgi:hypothetical protein
MNVLNVVWEKISAMLFQEFKNHEKFYMIFKFEQFDRKKIVGIYIKKEDARMFARSSARKKLSKNLKEEVLFFEFENGEDCAFVLVDNEEKEELQAFPPHVQFDLCPSRSTSSDGYEHYYIHKATRYEDVMEAIIE